MAAPGNDGHAVAVPPGGVARRRGARRHDGRERWADRVRVQRRSSARCAGGGTRRDRRSWQNATRGAAVAPFPPPWWPGVRATPAAPFLALGEPSQALHVALPLGGRAFYLLSSLEGCRRYRTLIET